MAKQLISVLPFEFLAFSVEFRREGLFLHITIWWVLKDGIYMIGIDVSQPFEGLAHY